MNKDGRIETKIRMSAELKKKLCAIAESRGISLNKLIQFAVRDYLAAKKGK